MAATAVTDCDVLPLSSAPAATIPTTRVDRTATQDAAGGRKGAVEAVRRPAWLRASGEQSGQGQLSDAIGNVGVSAGVGAKAYLNGASSGVRTAGALGSAGTVAAECMDWDPQVAMAVVLSCAGIAFLDMFAMTL